jgi:hypothetical protein
MTSTPTTRGKYRQQGLGDGLNTWGLTDGLNGVFTVMDAALHGVEVMALTGNKTLTSTNYVENESRYRALRFTDSSLSAAPTITVPATENWWLVDNATTYILTFSNGSSTATVPASRQAWVWTDGTTVYSQAFFEAGDQTYAGALSYTFSTTTTDADPGSGFLRLDNATASSATGIYASDNEINAVDVSAYLLSWDDGTSTVEGQIILRSVESAGVFHIYNLTAVTDNSGYVDLTVTYVAGAGSFVNGETVLVAFIPTGDKGDTGPQGPAGGTLSAETFTATSGQTTFTTSGGYAPGSTEVFLNGVLLKSTTDYTATNGTDVVLVVGAAEDDILYVRTFSNATTFSQDPSNIAVTGGTMDGVDFTAGSINSTPIGASTPAAGTFTTVTASGAVTATGGGALTGTWSDLGTVTTMDLNGGTIDGVTIGGASAAAATFTTLNATGGGALTGTWSDLGTVTTVDINGGTADNVVIGGSTAAAGTFTTLNATGGGALTGTWSNLGTVTTIDINGGTVDGVVIGGASAGAGTFTTITATTSVTTPLVTNAGTLALSATGANVIALSTNGSEAARIDSSGHMNVGLTGGSGFQQFNVAENIAFGANSTARTTTYTIGVGDDGLTNFWKVAIDVDAIGANGIRSDLAIRTRDGDLSASGLTEKVRITSSGNVGIGTSSPQKKLHLQGVGTSAEVSIRLQETTNSNYSDIFLDTGGNLRTYIGSSEAMRINSSGNVGIGTTAPDGTLHVHTASAGAVTANAAADDLVVENSGNGGITILTPAANTGYLLFGNPTDGANAGQLTFSGSGNIMGLGTSLSGGALAFFTNTFTERARIDSSGNLLVGKTSSSISTAGSELLPTGSSRFVTGAGITPMAIHRLADDGTLIVFLQGGTTEGDISVSGTTVSYNAFAGSHWSRFEGGATPEVLVGTLIESTGEQLTWPGESDEKHTFGRICNTVQSRTVAGVFMAYDTNDNFGDFYCTAVGRYLMRVEAGEDPQVGDLLESNGKYARISMDQTDIKTYHVARVMGTSGSNHAADGSFCVAVELMIGG